MVLMCMMSSYQLEDDNDSFILDFDDTGQLLLSSNEDENDSGIISISHMDADSPTDIIEETEFLLRKRSSSLTLEDPILDNSVESSIPRNSILGTKHISDALPVIEKMKPKKSVRFDMGLNIISEIQQPELHRQDSINSMDSFDNALNDGKHTSHDESADNNVLQASQLITDIEKLKKEKDLLMNDIKELKTRHEKEMKQLRTEYESRRESYYEELDQVRLEVDLKKEQIMQSSEVLHDESKEASKERLEEYNKNNQSLEEKEKSLEVRREQALQQEGELKEFEGYLERRHKSLSQKEDDLCILQDELEQLAVALHDRENELKDTKELLSAQENMKICNHDEDDIIATRDAYAKLKEVGKKLRKDLSDSNDKLVQKKDEVKAYEEEIKRLNSKNKLLESQLAVTIKHSPTHMEKKSTLSLISRNSKENLYSPSKRAKDSNNNNSMKSPQRNQSKYASPVSTGSSGSSADGGFLNDDLLEGERLSNDYLDGTASSPNLSPTSKKLQRNDASGSVVSRTCIIM